MRDCEETCPTVFVLPSGEKATIVQKFRKDGAAEGDVPADLASCARETAEACPVTVISTDQVSL